MTGGLATGVRDAAAAAAALEALGASSGVWAVGGALRDAALGRDVVDVDLAVDGDEAAAARAIAERGGATAFPLSEEFGAWRVVSRDGWHLDLSRLRSGSIEGDLTLRDFTINAMALPLAAVAGGDDGALVDPLGGRGDLERRRLRAAGEAVFEDDPLRLLRAARIAAGLGLEIDAATSELARRSASRAGEPAGERQFAELRLLVSGPHPMRGLELLDELDLTPGVLPELAGLRGVDQNPNHHLDVHGHTMQVLAEWLRVEDELPRFVGDAAADVAMLLAEPLADDLDRSGAMRFAALFHDLGKPATRDQSRGYITFIGHDRVGAEIVASLCRRLRTSRRLAAFLANITRHHLRLGFLVHQRPLAPRVVYEYLRATDPDPVEVTLLTVADRLSARGTGEVASEQMVAAHLDLAAEMVRDALAWRRDGPPRSPIRGDELAAELEIEPGPELGRLLGEIQAGVFAGEVRSRDEAVELARGAL
jgi:poly(A) polymerase